MKDGQFRSRIGSAAWIFVSLLILSSCSDDLRGSLSNPNPRPSPNPDGYLIVTHNVENLFDADGIAVYDDYKPVDADGNPQYTNVQILNKIRNIVRLMQEYGDGNGPDVIMAVEIEADHSPGEPVRAGEFLNRWSNTTLERMLGNEFDDVVADIPAELLLLKGMWDAGLKDYDVATVEPRSGNRAPYAVIKNVVFSRLPILHDRTTAHEISDARPILEVWLDVDGVPLATFTNHWKSGASNAQTEATRIQNAQVLRARLDELIASDPDVDFILGGDFNSDYNQLQRYTNMSETGVNSVLLSMGDERAVKREKNGIYNLWYEVPVDERRSDSYFENWGTLMHFMVSPGMYNRSGVKYVDNSFEVGIFPGLNANPINLQPRRWTNASGGIGFSDHFPLSMRVKVVPGGEGLIELVDPGVENAPDWRPLRVQTPMPDASSIIKMDPSKVAQYLNGEYYDNFFEVTGTLRAEDNTFLVGGMAFDLFSPSFRVPQVLGNRIAAGDTITIIGRLSNFRNRWQFIIDDRSFIRD
jgi:hypothetical protein